jgi:Flp pilus assembly protein TadB
VVGYGLKLAAAGIAFLCLGVLVIWLFGGIWTRVGLGAALVIVFGGLVLLAWRGDRKAKKAREGLDRV